MSENEAHLQKTVKGKFPDGIKGPDISKYFRELKIIAAGGSLPRITYEVGQSVLLKDDLDWEIARSHLFPVAGKVLTITEAFPETEMYLADSNGQTVSGQWSFNEKHIETVLEIDADFGHRESPYTEEMTTKVSKWFWISDYCKSRGLAPFNNDVYNRAEKAYEEALHESR